MYANVWNMPIDSFDPLSNILLTTPDEIAAYANPTRIAILGILAEAEATLSMVASRLGTSPANISHHIRRLLEARLIMLVETRATARNVEKYYRSSAFSYSVELESAKPADDHAQALARFRDELAAAAARRIRAELPGGEERALSRISYARISASDAESFRSRLEALAEEFFGAAEPQGDGYALGLALFRDFPSV
jgi:DNA-binding transcriptional ArsR family regulator